MPTAATKAAKGPAPAQSLTKKKSGHLVVKAYRGDAKTMLDACGALIVFLFLVVLVFATVGIVIGLCCAAEFLVRTAAKHATRLGRRSDLPHYRVLDLREEA